MPFSHSKIPPSLAHLWKPCPASLSMRERFPSEETDANRDGAYAHECAAAMLTGQPVGTMSDEMTEGVQMYVSDVNKHRNPKAPLVVEQQVACPYIHPESFGTPDAYSVCLDTLTIWDFKWGYRNVSAHRNWQMINYVAGIVALHPEIRYVNFRIVQPRAFANPIRHWGTAIDVLEPLFDELKQSAHDALREPCYKASVGHHCRDCTGRHVCEALRFESAEIVSNQYGAISNEISNVALGRELNILEQFRAILDHRITALEEHGAALINKGTPVPGREVRRKYGRLAWNKDKEDGEIVALGIALGVELSAGKKLLTPTQAIKAGIPESVIDVYASRPDNGLALVKSENPAGIFGK